jgi:hypothetical protein
MLEDAIYIFSIISEILAFDSLTDVFDSSASFLTSSATTAKPLPCSPALPASMLAFNASKLVCSDKFVINWEILDY